MSVSNLRQEPLAGSTGAELGELAPCYARITADGTIAWADDGWIRLGHPVDAVIGRSVLDLVSADVVPVLEALDQAKDGVPCTVLVPTWCGWSGSLYMRWVLTPAGDEVKLLALDARSERDEAEQYRLGVEFSPSGLLMVEADGSICLANRQVETMFGYGQGELLGQSVDILLPPRFRQDHPGKMAEYMGARAVRTMRQGADFKGLRRNGQEFDVEIGLNPLGTGRVLATVMDVSDRKRHEMELTHRVAELQRYRREMDLLSEMSSLLQHATDAEEAHRIVEGYGEALLPDIDVAVYALRASRDFLELASTWGTHGPESRIPWDGCWGMRRSQIHRSEGTEGAHVPKCGHVQDAGWHVCIPMSAHGQSSGVVSLSSPSVPFAEDRASLERAGRAVADQLALALTNISLREKLKSLAIRDPLTGLYNRRYLEETVHREFPRAQRKGKGVSVVMLDVDKFKRFNDTHGHQAADEVLSGLGQLMMSSMRKEDVCCRYGGEEFVILIPECEHDDAVVRAEALRAALEASKLGVTASIGVATWPVHGASWETVLRGADEALYRAKEGGRNQVVSA